MRRNRTIVEPIFVPEDLQQFEGWEVRHIDVEDHKPGIILQNPDTGEKRKLQFQPFLFDGEYAEVVRGKGNLNKYLDTYKSYEERMIIYG